MGAFTAVGQDEHEEVAGGREFVGGWLREDTLDDDGFAVGWKGGGDAAEDFGGPLVVPIVDDGEQEVAVEARRNALEEAASLDARRARGRRNAR